MKSLILAGSAFLAPFSLPALTCGSAVSGNVTLTSDMACTTQHGLIVTADHTTIDLNGYTISCSGPGVGGTCQRLLDPANQVQPPNTYIGIVSTGKSKVRIKGPGAITGFGIAVRLDGGDDLLVEDITVSGPPQPAAAANQRLITPGILVVNTKCGSGRSAVIRDNEVMNQTIGIFLQNAECVEVTNNHAHDNNSRFGDAHGIDVLNSRNNTVTRNVVERNGANRLGAISDSGIQLLNGVGGDTSGNKVERNFVSDNCGDGVAAVNGAHHNSVERNSARFNSTNVFGGQCLAVPVGTFFDLAERAAGAGNVWTANNQCRTNSPTIPGGVCGPLE